MGIPYGGREHNPLVSVVMSVYNGERFLKESLDSLLAQTYPHLEIILINDGSRDQTREIISTYKDERIVCIDRMENIGLTKSLNEGLRRARGEYVARLDVGDIALPSRIAEQILFLQQHPEIGILGAGIALFFHDGRTLREYVYASDHDTIEEQLLHFINPFPHSTLMFRRHTIEQLDGYCSVFERSQDYDLLLRALKITKLASLPRVLVRLRFDPLSLSYGSAAQLTYGIAALVRVHHQWRGDRDVTGEGTWEPLLRNIERFVQRHCIDKKMEAAKYRMLAHIAFSEHRWVDFLSHATQLFVHHPLFLVHTRMRVSAFIANHLEEIMPRADVCRG